MGSYDLMGSCVMDALDDRKILTVDIPNAFLQGDWPQDKYPGYIMFRGGGDLKTPNFLFFIFKS